MDADNAALKEVVSGLLRKLNVSEDPQLYVDTLAQNVSGHAMTRVSADTAKRKLAEKSPVMESFTSKYDELAQEGVPELERFCVVLSKIMEDKTLTTMLTRKQHSITSEPDISEAIRTPQGLRELNEKLKISPAPSSQSMRTAARTEDLTKSVLEFGSPFDEGGRMQEHTKAHTQFYPRGGTGGRPVAGTSGEVMSPKSRIALESIQVTPKPKAVATSPELGSKTPIAKRIPVVPTWTLDRPYLTGEHLEVSATVRSHGVGGAPAKKLGGLPKDVQEWLFVEDLLHAMMGVEGKYIKVVNGGTAGVQFTIDSDLDVSLQDLALRIIPLCSHYANVSRFLDTFSRYEYGLDYHAFCAAVRGLLKEYLVFVAQLETQFNEGKLTLQKLWFYVQPSLKSMEILHTLTKEARGLKHVGADLLNLLHSRASMMGGDPKTCELVSYLMEKSSVPYFEQLSNWVYHGKVDDPYGKFMVEDHPDVRKEHLNDDFNNSYWENRYTLRAEELPAFLAPVTEKILTAGKYLNVISECGREIACPFSGELCYTTNDREYVNKIERAFEFASKSLLDLLVSEKQLVARLRSIKHYFLLDQGDFCVHFLDLAEDILKKNVQEVSRNRLESLLDLSIRSSAAMTDSYKDDLTCSLLQYSLIDQLLRIINVSYTSELGMKRGAGDKSRDSVNPVPTSAITGLEAFTLDYKVEWPLSLIISKKAMTKYQLIFRHLFFCKHVERQLCNTWLHHQTVKEYRLNRVILLSHNLRQRMLHFLQNYEYYMMVEVLEPNWHILEEQLKSVKTLDEVLKVHSDFLDTCLKECMLTKPQLLKILTKLTKTCVIFADYTERFTQGLTLQEDAIEYETSAKNAKESREVQNLNRRKQRVEVTSEHINKLITEEGHIRTIRTFEKNFDTHLKDLLSALNVYSYTECDPHLNNLCTRLDYNGFYAMTLNKGKPEASH